MAAGLSRPFEAPLHMNKVGSFFFFLEVSAFRIALENGFVLRRTGVVRRRGSVPDPSTPANSSHKLTSIIPDDFS